MVSLGMLGGVAETQGDWAQAESAYRESLALRRQLVERLGGTPSRCATCRLRSTTSAVWRSGRATGRRPRAPTAKAWRSGASSSNGWVARRSRCATCRFARQCRRCGGAAGRLDAGRERLPRKPGAQAPARRTAGWHAESLRDLSVSLNKVGGVAERQGDWTQAESAYRESLALRRQLVERLGGTPESLRDLSVSLDNLGGVAERQGDWRRPRAPTAKAWRSGRQLVERLGGTPSRCATCRFARQGRRCGGGAGRLGAGRERLPRKPGARAPTRRTAGWHAGVAARPVGLARKGRRCGGVAGRLGTGRERLPRKPGAQPPARRTAGRHAAVAA
jgi:tetratricopeptide (TPR) repeat protein